MAPPMVVMLWYELATQRTAFVPEVSFRVFSLPAVAVAEPINVPNKYFTIFYDLNNLHTELMVLLVYPPFAILARRILVALGKIEFGFQYFPA